MRGRCAVPSGVRYHQVRYHQVCGSILAHRAKHTHEPWMDPLTSVICGPYPVKKSNKERMPVTARLPVFWYICTHMHTHIFVTRWAGSSRQAVEGRP